MTAMGKERSFLQGLDAEALNLVADRFRVGGSR